MRHLDSMKLQQENLQLREKLNAVREQLQKLKRVSCAAPPERIATGPEFTGCWAMLPLFSRTMLQGVLGPTIATTVIEALNELYRSTDLPITH